MLARGRDGLDGTKEDVEALGGRAIAVPTDVADAGQVERAAEAVERQFGPIDVWINNAMTSVFSPIAELEADEVKRVTEVTYLGTVYGTMAALKRMRIRDRGAIIQVGSALAYRAIPLQAAYCAAKSGVIRLVESLAAETAGTGVRVNCLLPDAIAPPGGGPGTPADDIAAVLVALAADTSRAITGAAIPV